MLISVIIPLPDHHGIAAQAIKSWCQKQTYPQNDFEILVVSDGTDPLEDEIQSYLRPQDRLLIKSDERFNSLSNSIYSMVNFAVQQALGEVVFITESHCLPHKDCLTEISHYLEKHQDIEIVCCRSYGINENLFAASQQKLFEQDFARKSQTKLWNRLVIRGFAIKRALFISAGGFESQYGHFSTGVLGAHLHALGYHVGYAEAATVSHYNESTFQGLIPNLIEYGESEIRYYYSGNQDYCNQYFPRNFTRQQKETVQLVNPRQQYWLELQSLFKRSLDNPEINQPKTDNIRFLAKNFLVLALGRDWYLLKSRLIMQASRIKLRLEQKNPEKYFWTFQKLWNQAIQYGWYKALIKNLEITAKMPAASSDLD